MSTLVERFHEEWLGYVQPDGLVVSKAVLENAQCIDRSKSRLFQPRLIELCPTDPEGRHKIFNLKVFLEAILGFTPDDYDEGDALPRELELYVSEGPQLLRPTCAFKAQHEHPREVTQRYVMLLWQLPDGLELDRAETQTGAWNYPPSAKFERLLRHSGIPIGLLTNGYAIRLIYAPHGESAGSMTFVIDDMASVGGRAILDAFIMLLSAQRFFGFEPERCLPALLHESRRYQTNVTKELAEQVFEALVILLQGFERAAERDGWSLLDDALAEEEDTLYAGLLTVLLRLVFVLYAEDRSLMPIDHDLYAEHYSVLALFDRLQRDHGANPDSMSQRFGAWGQLVALFRAIFLGAKHDTFEIPERRGELFYPHRFGFLEGWRGKVAPIAHAEQREQVKLPTIDDETVFNVLHRLLLLNGERLSYRTLDVEQIGSVYEALMGYHVRRATEKMVCFRGDNGERLWLGAEECLSIPKNGRDKWLKDKVGLSTAKASRLAKSLASCQSTEDAFTVLEGERLKSFAPISAGHLYLHPGEERRRTSSHYTPRSLSEPIVRKTLEPLIAAMGETPTATALLDLKICDPAMGSGAFLVEACRYLADQVVAAWAREGKTPTILTTHGDVVTHARRLVAQRCLYGVDKNAFAVSLAKLSLWLVTLAKDHPFTFVDHALRHGDSLVGLDFEQITSFHWDTKEKRQVELCRVELEGALSEAVNLRHAILELAYDERPHAVRQKQRLYEDAADAVERARYIGDLVVGAYFAETTDKAREAERHRRLDAYLPVIRDRALVPPELEEQRLTIRTQLPVFHWGIEFPEVFFAGRTDPLDHQSQRKAPAYFDAFIGNPPYMGKNGIADMGGDAYVQWLKGLHQGAHGNADYSAHFFRRASTLIGDHGTIGLIATNTIAQGDTRATGLQFLVNHGCEIYAATENMPWPGDAAVTVSVVHLAKGSPRQVTKGKCLLNGKPVSKINSRLRPKPERPDPVSLIANQNMSFVGSYVLGMGFTLTPEERDALIAKNKRNAERIFPYIGGEEVNTSPTHDFHRYVINFGEISLEEAEHWPDLIAIVREKVKPERDKLNDNTDGRRRKTFWWQFGRATPALDNAIADLPRCLVNSQTSKYLVFAWQPVDRIFAHSLYVFPFTLNAHFGLLQSRIHEGWARLLSSSLEDRLRYTPSDCFETFPFPDEAPLREGSSLDEIAKNLYETRARYMIDTDQGLTKTYNQLKDPECHEDRIVALRDLHLALDRDVLRAYGWHDIAVPHFTTPQTDDERAVRQAFDDAVIDRLFERNAMLAEKEAVLGRSRKTVTKGKPSSKPRAVSKKQMNLVD